MSDGEFDEGEIAAQIEFAADVEAVRVNRAVADEKFVADLAAGFVFIERTNMIPVKPSASVQELISPSLIEASPPVSSDPHRLTVTRFEKDLDIVSGQTVGGGQTSHFCSVITV